MKGFLALVLFLLTVECSNAFPQKRPSDLTGVRSSLDLKPGSYKADVTETFNSLLGSATEQRGTIRIKIESIDKEGNVKAALIRGGGLDGKGRLTGKIDEKGKLLLEGVIHKEDSGDWQFTLTATVEDKVLIKGKYVMASSLEVKGGFNKAEIEDDN